MITLSVLLQNPAHSRYSSRNQHTLGTAPESNSTIVERGNFDTPNTHT